MRVSPLVPLAAAILALGGLSTNADAGRFSAGFAVETWPDFDGAPLHGILLVGYDFDPWIAEGYPSIVFDTDTLRLGISEMQLGEAWRLGVNLTGETSVAGLLPYYYVDGQADLGRGFFASYAEADVRIKRLIPGGGWAELAVTGRQWLFEDIEGDTDPSLVKPDDFFVVMPRLHLGWWKLKNDPAWTQRHRFHPRLTGWAVGLNLGVDVRTSDSAWGSVDREGSTDADEVGRNTLRNQPEKIIYTARQWFLGGIQLNDRFRLEISEYAAFGVGEDDVTRERVGGMGPYVVEMPGAPWPAYLADKLVAARVSLPILVGGDVEIGPTFSAIYLQDKDRVGSEDFGLVYGAGATLDARFGDWQLDLRGGVAPPVRDDTLAWSAYLGLGYGFGSF